MMSLLNKLDLFNIKPVISNMFIQIFLACMIRLGLMTSKYQNLFGSRIEISTPLNSWKNVMEGVHRLNLNINPYLGDQFHEPPHNLYLYKHIINFNSPKSMPYVFIVCDVLTAILIFKTAKTYIKNAYKQQSENFDSQIQKLRNEQKVKGDSGEVEKDIAEMERNKEHSVIFLKPINIEEFPAYCAIMYLFNPFSVLNCAAQTTTVFTNLTYATLLHSLVHDKYWLSVFLVSFGASQSLYPITLIAPIILKFSSKKTARESVLSALGVVGLVCLSIAGLSFLSRYLSGSWSYMENVYSFLLNVKNLRPNTGLFWYMFTEMFEHYNDLFIAAFQINIFVLYIIPLSIRFRKDPIFLCAILIVLSTIFKSYPCLGDVGFYMSVIPIWFNLLYYLQQAFLVTTVLLVTVILGPVVWYLWIITGAANANFYFGVTLCYSTAQIFLVTDLLFAYVKREFWLSNNCKGMKEETAFRLILE